MADANDCMFVVTEIVILNDGLVVEAAQDLCYSRTIENYNSYSRGRLGVSLSQAQML